MQKTIQLQHHFDDYECMWNGIEDLYIEKTSEQLPPSFFFSMASFGSFCYLKTDKAKIKRMVVLGDGRTRQMYQFLAPIVGFDYHFCEFKSFAQAIKKAKKEVDDEHPVVLGALDMYYLSYFSTMYHAEHIPFHYFMMTGYDDKAEVITLLDCGRQEPQQLSYSNLEKAWNCSYDGLSKPFTLCTVRMNSDKNKDRIAKEVLREKAERFLNPPVGFIGYKGMEKFIKELPEWKIRLSKEEYDKVLFNMVQFYGTVPTIPNVLRGSEEPDEVNFCGGFDKISRILYDLGKECGYNIWLSAAKWFANGADVIAEITNVIVDYLANKKDRTDKLPELFTHVKDVLINGFSIILENNE